MKRHKTWNMQMYTSVNSENLSQHLLINDVCEPCLQLFSYRNIKQNFE